jgi:regulator of protease activity HflC (stomatin/prohibitin superfamily)
MECDYQEYEKHILNHLNIYKSTRTIFLMQNKKGQESIGAGLSIGLIVFVIIVFIAVILLFSSTYIIKAGQRGVLLTWGAAETIPISEGLHFKIPIKQSVVKMDIQTQKYETDLTAASKDLQDVSTKIAINYHVAPERVPEIYRDLSVDYAARIIQPLEQETNKGITAQYTAEELITKREQVREGMKTSLVEKLQPRGIVVEEVSIINFAFSPSFTQAIEAKVTAEQNALAAKNKLAQVEYEAQQRVAQAEGEARAIQIQAEAIKAQGGAAYVQLQAIRQWDGKLPTIMGGNAMPFIDMRTIASTPSNLNSSA